MTARGEPPLPSACDNGNDNNIFQGRRRTGLWTKFHDIPVHGDPITAKADKTIRLYFENVNGFVLPIGHINRQNKNKFKQKFLSLLMSRLEVDIFGGAETRLHWDLTPKSMPLRTQLSLHDGCKISTAHNVNERFSQCQQGGTFITAMEEVSTYVTEVGIDNEGLGRWTWMKLAGATTTTKVIFA